MGGQGSAPSGRGFEGAEPLASPNVLHWVGWLPGTMRCGAGPAVSQRTRKMLAVSRLMDHFGKVSHHNGEGFAL